LKIDDCNIVLQEITERETKILESKDRRNGLRIRIKMQQNITAFKKKTVVRIN